ncbi:THAP domain-containing protein 6 [Merluccius polli]|uniref:THAP domain-containing protein 1 n=1 Tax=Merluccius polli TaxID=89951 RepID=A0AA47MVW3_MERPO|nr:THAP domain-containing protein 6 [Merluccius polli]
MPGWCSAYSCSNERTVENRNRGITFHKFPKDKDVRKKWEVALRREGFTASDYSIVCSSEHFKQADFDRMGPLAREGGAGLRLPPEELKKACLWPLRIPQKWQPHTHNLNLMMRVFLL